MLAVVEDEQDALATQVVRQPIQNSGAWLVADTECAGDGLVRKLVSKTHSGPRVTRRYDAAQTPFHRPLASGALSQQMTRQLNTRSKNLDPYRLKLQFEAAPRTLAARALRSDYYVRQP